MTHEYEMTLKFKLTTMDGPLDPDFDTALKVIFNEYEDGRYPFDVEMIQNGLSDCMRHAAQWLLEKDMITRYGDEMIESAGGKLRQSRWYMESQQVKPVVPHVSEPPTVSIS